MVMAHDHLLSREVRRKDTTLKDLESWNLIWNLKITEIKRNIIFQSSRQEDEKLLQMEANEVRSFQNSRIRED